MSMDMCQCVNMLVALVQEPVTFFTQGVRNRALLRLYR